MSVNTIFLQNWQVFFLSVVNEFSEILLVLGSWTRWEKTVDTSHHSGDDFTRAHLGWKDEIRRTPLDRYSSSSHDLQRFCYSSSIISIKSNNMKKESSSRVNLALPRWVMNIHGTHVFQKIYWVLELDSKMVVLDGFGMFVSYPVFLFINWVELKVETTTCRT